MNPELNLAAIFSKSYHLSTNQLGTRPLTLLLLTSVQTRVTLSIWSIDTGTSDKTETVPRVPRPSYIDSSGASYWTVPTAPST
jgi:hypothetical protein